jgi:hypothetical protein
MRDFEVIDVERLRTVAGGESVGATDMVGPVNQWLTTADHGIDTLNRLTNVIQKYVLMARPDFQGFAPGMLDPNGTSGGAAAAQPPQQAAAGPAPRSRPRASVSIDPNS